MKGNPAMNTRNILLTFSILVLLAACGSSPEKQKAKAEARQTEEETKTMQEYKACVKKAKTDQDKLDACERLMKAVP
jgi:outer membrane biogenesis lipoprotein LolB